MDIQFGLRPPGAESSIRDQLMGMIRAWVSHYLGVATPCESYCADVHATDGFPSQLNVAILEEGAILVSASKKPKGK